ncbi:MAG: hypothetical protein O3B31_12625 [Chloroflexi bacterium]|nr:hypothetical protein [Chloroflexota bacterium]MDA1004170.1 hypothetical protein [Chloroflexota bacterium]
MNLFTDTSTVRRALISALAPLALVLTFSACGLSATPAAPVGDTAAATTSGAVADADVLAEPVISEADYTATVRALLDEIAAATDEIAAVLGRADVESATWQAELATALDMLVATQDAVAALDPPDSVTLVQELLEEATGQFAAAAAELVGGLKVMDLDQIQRGVDELGYGIEALAEARAQLPLQS